MKNLNFFTCLLVVAVSFLSINNLAAQACLPAGTQPVSGVVTGNTGSFNFTNVPTGNVIELQAPAADVYYEINLCATNPTAGNPDGTNDSYITVVSANAAGATALGTGDDGCESNTPNGYGPTVMSYTAAAAGSVFLYLTEYGASGNCVADGVNSAYIVDITVSAAAPVCEPGVLTAPATQSVCPDGTFDLSLDGSQDAPTFGLQWDNTGTDGTGGTGGPVALNLNLTATGIPTTWDADLLGLLSGNNLPPLAGTWNISIVAYDASGTACAITSATTVTFLGVNNIFVDQSATGANNGTSWADAFTDLQSALAVADPNACSYDILVAEGSYVGGTARGNFFTINKDCRIFGGYAAGGAATSTPETTPTVLSGDIDEDGTLAGNTFHVVAINSGATAILVDLTIEGGNADNPNSFGRSRGGGVYISDAIVGMFRCNIINNYASFGGGVFSTLSETTLFNDCVVSGNEAGNGSALYHSNETRMFIEQTRIVDNNSTIRCAVEINNSLYTSIENSVIANNASANANAIAFIATNRNQLCDINNTTILGETKNKLLITMQVGYGDTLDVNMCNTIVAHQNPNFTRNIKEFNNNVLNFTHTNSYFAGADLPDVVSTGTNSLFSDVDGDLLLNADYSLMACSPGVDAGDNTCFTRDLDIDGNPGIFNTTIDMGAHEVQSNCFGAREASEEIEEIETNTISIFPNPANDIVNIRTDLEEISVVVNDILGRAIIQSSNQRSIDISKLPRGTYVVQIFQGDELKGTEKLMKN